MDGDHVVDPDFGPLTWNSQVHRWQGRATMGDGTPFALDVESIGYVTQLPPFVDTNWDKTITVDSREALKRIRNADSVLRTAVMRDYWPLYPRWNEDATISPERFSQRLRLQSVTLLPNGTAQVFFDDDNMFAGHAIVAHLDPDGKVRHVELFG